MAETYPVVLLVEQALSPADAVQVRSLHEELVAEGVNGWLVPFGAEAIRERLHELRDDVALRARMSVAALASSQRYAWDRVADEYHAVLADAAGATPPGTR